MIHIQHNILTSTVQSLNDIISLIITDSSIIYCVSAHIITVGNTRIINYIAVKKGKTSSVNVCVCVHVCHSTYIHNIKYNTLL